jgi:AcrR family transcriptional regulator
MGQATTIHILMNHRSRRPPQQTIVPDLLDAVERLCATSSPETVGMRDIAEEAGLSVGVAYRYFDSKPALIGAAMDRLGERLALAVTGSDDLTAAMHSLWQAFEANPAFINIGSWMILDGQNMSEVMTKHPAARDLVAWATADGVEDPQTFAGVVLLVGLAGAFYGTAINRAFGRPDDDQRLFQSAADAVSVWAERSATPTET